MADRPARDPAVEDLHLVVDLALRRGADLLTAGERLVVARIRGLRGPAASLYARLTARVPSVFVEDRLEAPGVEDPAAAVTALIAAGLADRLVPWRHRIEVLTAAELRDLARDRGLPTSGRKSALIERLVPHPAPLGRRFVRVRHRGLLRRLEQWAFLRRRPDRSALVVERLGHVRWPEYTPTGGRILHARRADLRAWEALWAGRDTLRPEALLAALDARATWPPGGLDLRRSLRRRILTTARDLERAGDPAGARALYAGLVEGGHVAPARVAVRVARTLEAEDRAEEAWRHLRAVLPVASGRARLAILRSGRRLAARLRRGWAPDPPLRVPTERHLRLPAAPSRGARPRYRGGARQGVVEEAVIGLLEAEGRRALHAEGPLWTTLFALLFADAYFLPVPGMLPVRFLAGPLDAGTPSFAPRRPEAVAAVLDAVSAGEAPARVARADARWRDTWLAGAAWSRAGSEDLVAVAEGMGPQGLRAVLEVLLRRGWRASRGLPDLVVLPGAPARLPGALPSRVGDGLLLAEIKGPTDTVRDEQALWFDRLLRAGAPVELWHVTPTGEATR